MKILVFGANSSLGKDLIPELEKNDYKLILSTSKNCNLLKREEVDSFIRFHSPNIVINLAAKVGGVYHNMSHQYDYIYENIMLNTNVIDSCRTNNIQRLLSFGSTCIFPDKLDDALYPLSEDTLHLGPPTSTSFGYAYSKRLMVVQTELCNKQYGTNFSYLSPCNIFSENSKFDENSHYIDKLIRRIWEYNTQKIDKIEMRGGSSAKRQFIWGKDIVRIILKWLEIKDCNLMCNVAPPENISIKQMTELTIKSCNCYDRFSENKKLLEVLFLDESMTGQINKEISSKKLLNNPNFKNFKFTPLENGIKTVYESVCTRWK